MGELDGLVHRRGCGYAVEEEELVEAEAEQRQHGPLQPVHPLPGELVDDMVQRAAPAQYPIHQLGQEAAVGTLEFSP